MAATLGSGLRSNFGRQTSLSGVCNPGLGNPPELWALEPAERAVDPGLGNPPELWALEPAERAVDPPRLDRLNTVSPGRVAHGLGKEVRCFLSRWRCSSALGLRPWR
jgi:hypothetical protein